jgi:hypothetical protein
MKSEISFWLSLYICVSYTGEMAIHVSLDLSFDNLKENSGNIVLQGSLYEAIVVSK